MTLTEYQYEEYKADVDLIGRMTKPEEESNEPEEEDLCL